MENPGPVTVMAKKNDNDAVMHILSELLSNFVSEFQRSRGVSDADYPKLDPPIFSLETEIDFYRRNLP